MSFDVTSYEIGKKKGYEKGKEEGSNSVVLEGDDYTFTDQNNDGHVVVCPVPQGAGGLK